MCGVFRDAGWFQDNIERRRFSHGDQNVAQKLKAVADSDFASAWLAHAHAHMTDAATLANSSVNSQSDVTVTGQPPDDRAPHNKEQITKY